MMENKIEYPCEFFNPKDTLECGQIFRFYKFEKGYKVISKNKIAYLYVEGDKTIVETDDVDYFYNFFDLKRDYNDIYSSAINTNNEFLTGAANFGKGIRILNQDKEECLYSFIISQNNNIPRIKGTIEKLCAKYGEKVSSRFGDFYAFPDSLTFSELDDEDYKELGFGYRGEYFIKLSIMISFGVSIDSFDILDDDNLYTHLTSLKGVGPKVANCVMLFGFHRTNTFPVDTWIEKIYRENFDGTLQDRKKITDWFIDKFGKNSGYFQQYLFYYKRQ